MRPHSPHTRRGRSLRLFVALFAAAAVVVLWTFWPIELPPASEGVKAAPSSLIGALHAAAKTTTTAAKNATAAAISKASSNVGATFKSANSRAHGSDWVERTLCSDTCARANDGVCQEGRRGLWRGAGSADGPFENVECDLGTDCSDCGPWRFMGPADALAWTPVKEIQEKKFQLNVCRTKTPVSFFMPYTDPKADTDVSGQMASPTALIEPGLTWVWHRLLSEGCRGVNGERSLVLDIGGNFGYYSLMSAAMGCRVIAWEPVPYFAAFFQYGLLRNNLTGSVQLRAAVVSDQHGAELTMVVPTSGIWGTAGIGGKNLDASQRIGRTDKVVKMAERVDRVVLPQEVLLMKVDVEGFEPSVLASAKGLLQKGNVQNIIMEYSPGVAETNKDWRMAEENPAKLLGLTRAGYTILHMDEPFRVLHGFDWGGPLPPMPVALPAALHHDLEDAKRLQEGRHGCPLPPAVQAAGGMWDCPGDFQIERLHPKGFRPTFGHNTNVWAFKASKGPGVKGAPASLVPPDFNMQHYFTPLLNRTYPQYPGHAFRTCATEPPQAQVKFRCHCNNSAICGEQERAVAEAALANKMPPLPLDKPVNAAEYEVARW